MQNQRWTCDDIPWHLFDARKVDPDMLTLIKTASLIEANAADYVRYLRNVFAEDEAFKSAVTMWGVEESLHGTVLARYGELADPDWSFHTALSAFQQRYQLALDAQTSIRGSRLGELIARQVVETGTSSFYSALRDAAQEPVLKAIAARIASDEYFHYRLFARFAVAYAKEQPLSLLARLKITLTRFQEADDDELGYAYFSANILPGNPHADYFAHNYGKEYWARAMRLYRPMHISNAVSMMLRATGLKAHGRLSRLIAFVLWRHIHWQSRSLSY
jgi:rubrerythrin